MDWMNKNTSLPPPMQVVIVNVREEVGDKPRYFTTYAWYLHGRWFHDNEQLTGEVTHWAYFPQPYQGRW